MMREVDVTIIGGGPVGLFAAFYAGMRGMSTRIIDSLPELGGQLTALYPEQYVYDMPGFPKVLAKDLAREMATQALQFGADIVLGETAAELIRDGRGGGDVDENSKLQTPNSKLAYVIRTASGIDLPTRTVI